MKDGAADSRIPYTVSGHRHVKNDTISASGSLVPRTQHMEYQRDRWFRVFVMVWEALASACPFKQTGLPLQAPGAEFTEDQVHGNALLRGRTYYSVPAGLDTPSRTKVLPLSRLKLELSEI